MDNLEFTKQIILTRYFPNEEFPYSFIYNIILNDVLNLENYSLELLVRANVKIGNTGLTNKRKHELVEKLMNKINILLIQDIYQARNENLRANDDALEIPELSLGERVAAWCRNHKILICVLLVFILLVGGFIIGLSSYQHCKNEKITASLELNNPYIYCKTQHPNNATERQKCIDVALEEESNKAETLCSRKKITMQNFLYSLLTLMLIVIPYILKKLLDYILR